MMFIEICRKGLTAKNERTDSGTLAAPITHKNIAPEKRDKIFIKRIIFYINFDALHIDSDLLSIDVDIDSVAMAIFAIGSYTGDRLLPSFISFQTLLIISASALEFVMQTIMTFTDIICNSLHHEILRTNPFKHLDITESDNRNFITDKNIFQRR